MVAAAGDPSLTCFMRSSSKPLQALPLVRARDDLPDDELAIACASHHDTPEQVAAVRALLARAEATEADLELGLQEGRPPELIHNNCSGNHAGHARRSAVRAAGRRRATACPSTPSSRPASRCTPRRPRSSRRRSPPAQTAAASSPSRSRSSGWRTPSRASSRCPAATRVAAAMRARPDLVGGPDGADYLLMRGAPGWLAKGGAEGLLCAAGPDGIGVAIKTEDGASRAHGPALAAFLGALGVDLPDLAARPVVEQRAARASDGETSPTSFLSQVLYELPRRD